MSLETADFTAEIRRVAASLGRDACSDRVSALQEILRTIGQVDPETGAVHVEVDGKAAAVGAFLQEEIRKFPAAAQATQAGSDRPDAMVKFTLGKSTSHRRADDALVTISRSFQAAEAAQIAKQVATWSNPWRKGKENRTRQQVIINTNPALAARFKAEAKI